MDDEFRDVFISRTTPVVPEPVGVMKINEGDAPNPCVYAVDVVGTPVMLSRVPLRSFVIFTACLSIMPIHVHR